MQGKLLVWTLAMIGILIIVGPASGCKLCGMQWCSCGAAPLLPAISRSWQLERPLAPPPIELSLPVMEQQQLASPLCRYCGGYSRGYHGHSPRNEAAYSSGYYCRCSPRRQRCRYDDY